MNIAQLQRMLRGVREGSDVPPPEPSSKLVPGPGWDSTPGSGWGVAGGVARPTPVTRTFGSPWCRPLFADYEAVSGDYPLSVDAGTSVVAGLMYKLQYLFEGGVLDEFYQTLYEGADANGVPDPRFGYNGILDCAAAVAMHPTGSGELFIKAVPLNPLMQERLIGPIILHPRLPVTSQSDAGAGKVVEKILYCKPSASSDTAGVRYRSIKSCLDWCVTNYGSTKLVKILCEDSNTDYRLQKVAVETVGANARTHWTEIEALDGTTNVVMGDGINLMDPTNNTGLQYDLISWGKNVRWDWAKVAPNGGAMSLRNNTTRSMRWRACELYCSTFGAAWGGAGSGVNALLNGLTVPGYFVVSQGSTAPMNIYFENVNCHDMPDYGLSFCRLIRNCTMDMIGGSPIENVWGAIHGVKGSRAGGPFTTLLDKLPALGLTYVGGATVEIAISGNVGGQSRTLSVWENGSAKGTLTLSKTPTIQIADVATWWSALGSGYSSSNKNSRLAAIFLSETVPATAGPILRQTLTSGVEKVLTTWVDIHADAMVWHTAPKENVAVRFVEFPNILGSALISFNESMNTYALTPNKTLATAGVTDIGIRDCIVYDPGTTFSGGYMGPATRHLYVGHCSFIGGPTNWTDSFDPDPLTQFLDNYFTIINWSARVPSAATPTKPAVVPIPTDMNINSLGVLASLQPTLPIGADANSKRFTGAQSSLFADLSDPMAIDATPTTNALLPDGTPVGARNLNGTWKLAA